MKSFFIEIETFWASADKFGRWIGIFLAKLSALILVQWIPCPFFSIIQPLFLQKTKPLYPSTKYLFWIVIWIWATKNLELSHHMSVFRGLNHPPQLLNHDGSLQPSGNLVRHNLLEAPKKMQQISFCYNLLSVLLVLYHATYLLASQLGFHR